MGPYKEEGTIYNNTDGPVKSFTMQNERSEKLESPRTERVGKKTMEAFTIRDLAKSLLKKFLIVAAVAGIFGSAFYLQSTDKSLPPDDSARNEEENEAGIPSADQENANQIANEIIGQE